MVADENIPHMLTTVDNPYNPFTNWDEWYMWDQASGYYTSELLARVTRSSDDLSEPDQELAIEEAIDDICRENVLGIFRKIAPGDIPGPSQSDGSESAA